MSSGVKPVGLWGLAVAAIAVLGALGFGLDLLPTLLLGGAGLGGVLLGLASRAAGPGEGAAEADVPHRSPGAVVAALGLVLALVGSVFGQLLLWPGLGLLVLGLVLAWEERRAERAREPRADATPGTTRAGPVPAHDPEGAR